MRTFIAIEISEEIKNILAQIESHLIYAGADVKWVKPENVHLTLKFLGEIDEKKAAEVTAILDSIARMTKPFELNVKDIGAFPKIEHPRVIWVGLVWIAIATDKKRFAKEFRFRGSRQDIKWQASQTALNMIRACVHL